MNSIRRRLMLVSANTVVVVVVMCVAAFLLTTKTRVMTLLGNDYQSKIVQIRESRSNDTGGSSTMYDDDTVAKELAQRVRVLCWVMTMPSTLQSRVKYLVRTWGRRCNKLVIISSVAKEEYGIVAINVSEGREHLTEKTLGGFHYVYKHHFDDADWFLKTDDDTYVIMENLRYLLSEEDTNKPIYFGHHFKAINKYDYSSGGSGLVISKEALRRFGRAGNDPKVCRQTGTYGDEAFGECMGSLGVQLKNSTDKFGKSRFHCFPPYNHIAGALPRWLFRYDKNGIKQGVESLSDYVISFHYVSKQNMDTLEYLLYHARPYGIEHRLRDLNQH